jgi:transposase InsO family protein
MIPSMSRPANPYDNASCESFLSGAATLQFFQPAEDAESEGAKSAKKNNRTIGVCSFSCLSRGVHLRSMC